ncbi:hypothetical protein EXW94_28380 [Enterobacter sp. JMULE2]|nr:hypothetical protein [Enterobacter sp. JMULE2]NTZ41497.1 hypothetical protein [Enterobacter sp. JMULE2]
MPRRPLVGNNYLKSWALWVNGSHIPAAMEYTPPALAVIESEFRAGHMDIPTILDDGMEALSVTMKLKGVDERVLALFGFQAGGRPRFAVREGYIGGNGNEFLTDEMSGLITRYESDARTESERAKCGVTITLRPDVYKRTFNQKELIYIEPLQGIRRVNGVEPFGDINKWVMGRS